MQRRKIRARRTLSTALGNCFWTVRMKGLARCEPPRKKNPLYEIVTLDDLRYRPSFRPVGGAIMAISERPHKGGGLLAASFRGSRDKRNALYRLLSDTAHLDHAAVLRVECWDSPWTVSSPVLNFLGPPTSSCKLLANLLPRQAPSNACTRSPLETSGLGIRARRES